MNYWHMGKMSNITRAKLSSEPSAEADSVMGTSVSLHSAGERLPADPAPGTAVR